MARTRAAFGALCLALLVAVSLQEARAASPAAGSFDKVKDQARETLGLKKDPVTEQVNNLKRSVDQSDTAQRVKAGASDAYNTGKGKASEAYDSASKATGKGGKQASDYASDSYAAAGKHANRAGKDASSTAQQASEYVSDTLDSVRTGSEERYQALKDQIAGLGVGHEKTYYQKAKDYITGHKTPAEQVQDAASDAYKTAGKHAQSAYEAAAQAGSDAYATAGKAGSDAYDAAADTASDAYDAAAGAVGSNTKSAKQGYNKASKQAKQAGASLSDSASDAYDSASEQAGKAYDSAGEYAGKGKKAAGDAYDSASESSAASMGDLKAALASYNEWLQDVMQEVKGSTSKSAQDAASWGSDSSGSAKKYSEDSYQAAKKQLGGQLSGARKTSDGLLDRTENNAKELWESLSENWYSASGANKKSLAKEWGLAQKGHGDFSHWLDGARGSLADAYVSAEQGAESAWAQLKKTASKATDSIKSEL